MNVGIRITSLSLIMSIYMVWAFRGVEYDPQEAIGALLVFLGGFLVLTVIAVPIYKMTGSKAGGTLAEFAFRCWLVTATLVTIGWLVFFAQDPAAAGFFRDNILIGAAILIVVVAAANFAVTQFLAYLTPKRKKQDTE